MAWKNKSAGLRSERTSFALHFYREIFFASNLYCISSNWKFIWPEYLLYDKYSGQINWHRNESTRCDVIANEFQLSAFDKIVQFAFSSKTIWWACRFYAYTFNTSLKEQQIIKRRRMHAHVVNILLVSFFIFLFVCSYSITPALLLATESERLSWYGCV